MAKYKITNYGNTRKFPYLGDYYEISKGCSIETNDEKLADEFKKFHLVDVVALNQPKVKKESSEQEKKVTTRKKVKKIKRSKKIRRTKK